MTVVKITVLETSLKKDLADEYAVPNLEPCPILKAGQVFYATNTCPKGMCDAAWRTINQYVFALACGVREFYGGGWMKEPVMVLLTLSIGIFGLNFKRPRSPGNITRVCGIVWLAAFIVYLVILVRQEAIMA